MEHESEPANVDGERDYKSSLNTENGEQEYSPQNKEDSKPGHSKDSPKSPSPSSGRKSPSRESPEPSCAICLGPLQNKSFIDSCFHTFCFSCLVSWSKVKPECPLCKQQFKSIVHNVRSLEDYDQYYIVSRSSQSSWQSADGRRFRYSSTLTAERVLERRRLVVDDIVGPQTEYQRHRLIYAPHSVSRSAVNNSRESEYQRHRMTYAPHSVSASAYSRENELESASEIPQSRPFRQQVYEDRLWVVASKRNSKVRCASAEFYRQNPACTHRLIPWLNRELLALLHNSQTRVMFVMDLILALIMRFDIKSQEFHIHMQPYLGKRTAHFVHEFYHYATSPHDMSRYDDTVVYEQVVDSDSDSHEEVENSYHDNHDFLCNDYRDAYDSVVLSSPGSDVILLSSSDSVPVPTTSAAASSASTSRPTKKKRNSKHQSKRVRKLCLKRNQENNSWNVQQSSPPVPQSSRYGMDYSDMAYYSELNAAINATSSTSGSFAGPSTSIDVLTVPDASSEDDEKEACEIVTVVPPRHERTPEIISLLSSSEDESVTPIPLITDNPNDNDGLSLLLRASEVCDEQTVSSTTAQPSKESNDRKDKSLTELFPLDLSTKTVQPPKSEPYFHLSSVVSINDSSSNACSYPISQSSQSSHRTSEDNHMYSDSTDISGYNTDEGSAIVNKQEPRKRLRSVVSSVSSDAHHVCSSSSHHSSHGKKRKHKKKKKHTKHKHRSHSKDKERDP